MPIRDSSVLLQFYPKERHCHSETDLTPIRLRQVDDLINVAVVLHVDEVTGLLDRATVEAPLVFVQTRCRQHSPFFVYVIFYDDLIATVLAAGSELEHVARVPALLIELGEAVLAGVEHVAGVHDVLVVVRDLDSGRPVLHPHVHDVEAGLPLGIVILDFEAVIVHDVLHHDHRQLGLLEDSDDVAGNDGHEVDDGTCDVHEHVVVAA